MKARVCLTSVLAATIGLCALTAEEPRQSKWDRPHEMKMQGLADRCQKMLDLQIAVYDGTKSLNKVIVANADKKPRPKDKLNSVKLSEKQKAIIAEATTVIDMLKTQGATAAFPEVFEMLRTDMKRVQSHLDMNDVGSATQAIEDDIIDTLREMILALNKT
jgi:hypothetical protein